MAKNGKKWQKLREAQWHIGISSVSGDEGPRFKP